MGPVELIRPISKLMLLGKLLVSQGEQYHYVGMLLTLCSYQRFCLDPAIPFWTASPLRSLQIRFYDKRP